MPLSSSIQRILRGSNDVPASRDAGSAGHVEIAHVEIEIDRAREPSTLELTATYTLPQSIAAKARAQNASIVFGARNLHVWTKWTAADPEQNYSQGDTQSTLLTAGPAKYYTVRLNLRF